MGNKTWVIITTALLFGALMGVWAGFSVSSEKEEHITRLTYDIEGSFAQQAYEKPKPEKVVPNPVYFTKVIETIDVSYSYRFLPEEPVTRVTEEVGINAVISCPTSWGETEVELVPRAEKEGDFTISFPFDSAPLRALADNITTELGASGCVPDIILKAIVHTSAQTGAGVVEDEFVQAVRVKVTGSTLEWFRPLTVSQIGYANGLRYEHQGEFSHAIKLKPNILFGAVTMEPEKVTFGEPAALKPEKTYDRKILDRIEGTFSYKIDSSKPIEQVTNEAEVTAILGTAEGWRETFVLVPRSQRPEDFSVTFSLDVPLLYAVIESMEPTEEPVSSQELTIAANVTTTAQSEFGPIEEVSSYSQKVTLGPDKVEWPEKEAEKKSGSIEETIVVSNPSAGVAKMGSLGALGMTAIAFLYSMWSYREARRRRISRIEADSLQVKSRQDLVVDVERLPAPIWNEETVVEMGSLNELFKTADSLLKPVLHLAEPERHIYCVIDGMTRYQYMSLPEEPAPPPAPETPGEDSG